ncbi:hypothetical protein V7O66_05440 [Methanolobus sp. ZRKC3]|uniref:hypothetical protein n=1 Tax=Methanolobus sp. ZRKC3 TaxID=3125786 RepID=UPI0032484280
MAIGCTETDSDIVVVQTDIESSLDISKGVVYNIDIWVKNEGDDSQSARVTVDLISNTGNIRDSANKTVNLQPEERKQLTFILDGESGVEYDYEYRVEKL